MTYRILRTDKAEEQLREIIYYIADDSGSVEIALEYLDKIEAAINRLHEFPQSGCTPKYTILKKQGYRVVITEKHLVFYKINEDNKLVIIYAIVDGRREYRNLLSKQNKE
jgi:toxin ParE1/3/4